MLQRAETFAVVTSARERARAHIGTSLSDLDALTIALAAATVDATAAGSDHLPAIFDVELPN